MQDYHPVDGEEAMAENCLFCKVVSGEIKTETVYEDEKVLGFKDINPQAPVHVLIVPKRHVATLNDLGEEDTALAGGLLLAAKHVAKDFGIAEPGYRAVVNCNPEGNQAIFHVHLHLLGGRQMKWPPG